MLRRKRSRILYLLSKTYLFMFEETSQTGVLVSDYELIYDENIIEGFSFYGSDRGSMMGPKLLDLKSFSLALRLNFLVFLGFTSDFVPKNIFPLSEKER